MQCRLSWDFLYFVSNVTMSQISAHQPESWIDVNIAHHMPPSAPLTDQAVS